MYKFKIFNSFNNDCLKVWKKFEENSAHNFFQSWSYIYQLIQNSKNSLRIVVIYSDDQVIAILPLEIKRYFVFKVLQWIGTGRSDFCNPLIVNDEKFKFNETEFLDIWKKILNKMSGFDLIFFNNQPTRIDKTYNPFAYLREKKTFSKVYQIKIPNIFNNYKTDIKKFNKKHYYEIHRTLIKLSNLNKISKVSFEVESNFTNEFEISKIIKRKSDQLNYKKIKHNLNKNFINTLQNLVNSNKKMFFIFNLRINNEIVSSCFGMIYRNIFYYYVPMIISQNFEKYKPGKILLIKLVEWCIEKKIKTFDFGLGEEHYKKYFSNFSISLFRYFDYINSKGFIFYIILKIYFFKKNFKIF